MEPGDLRHIARSLLHARWFTVGALLTFSLGVGLNIAVFAVVDRVLFRPLPFDHADRLATVHPVDPSTRKIYAMFPRRLLDEACRAAPAVEDVGFAGNTRSYSLDGTDSPTLRLTEASYNLLDVLGVRPILGRGFTREDERLGLRLALVREEVWRDRYGASRDVLSTVHRDRDGAIGIIGVLPAGFINPSINRATTTDGLMLSSDRRAFVPAPIVRLRPAVSSADAQNQISLLVAALERDESRAIKTEVLVEPLREGIFWNISDRSTIVFWGAVLVWLIACTNLGTLMVARTASREELWRIRMRIGATRVHVATLVVAEIALLCAAGSALATLVLSWALRGLGAIVPVTVGNLAQTTIDQRLIAFATLAAVLGVLIASGYPLWNVAKLERTAGQTASGVARRPGRGLLVAESAFGIALVVAGVFALRSFVGLARVDLGYSPEGLHSIAVGTRNAGDASTRLERCRQTIAALRAVHGVSGASAVDVAVGSGEVGQRMVDDQGRQVVTRHVFSGYFGIMRTALVAGRFPTDAEIQAGAPIAVVSASAAQLLFPEVVRTSLVGRPLHLGGDLVREIVGVVADTREHHARMATPEVLLPAGMDLQMIPTFLLRTDSQGPPNTAALRSVVRRHFGSDATIVISSAERRLQPRLRDPRFYAVLFGGFGLTALLLPAVGLFALTSYELSRRRQEIGIRLAFGATRKAVAWMYVTRAVVPVVAGVAIGSLVAFWMARSFEQLLQGIDARDVKTYGSVAVLYVAVAGVAAWRPARAAASADPAAILRSE